VFQVDSSLVVRVVEDERCGLVACASSHGVSDEPVNVSGAAYAMPGFRRQ
jgi:hypothetical protein